jgi:hypothetical protein
MLNDSGTCFLGGLNQLISSKRNILFFFPIGFEPNLYSLFWGVFLSYVMRKSENVEIQCYSSRCHGLQCVGTAREKIEFDDVPP